MYPTWDTWIDPEPSSASAGEPALSPPPPFIKRIPAAVGCLLWPLEDGVELLWCDHCKRRLRVAAFLEHVQDCAASMAADKASAHEAAGNGATSTTGDKRGAPDELPGNRRKKNKRPFNIDAMCGVICYDRGGQQCMRSLSCKTHPIKAKRIVEVCMCLLHVLHLKLVPSLLSHVSHTRMCIDALRIADLV